jgi:hypothetical protein
LNRIKLFLIFYLMPGLGDREEMILA